MVSIVELLPSLPLEIRDEIFQYLSYKEHWTLAAVCKSWRILILNWQPLWDCLPVNERCPIFPHLLPYSSFIQGGFVKQISVDSKREQHVSDMIKFIENRGFYAITKAIDKQPYGCTVTAMLNHSTSTLTHVSMNALAKNANNIQPDTILRLCPNLISFIFEAWVPPLLDDESLCKSKKLTNFKLRSLSDLSLRFLNISAFYDFDPEPFLESAPNLRYFSTNIAHLRLIGPRFGKMIRKHCPKLVSLTLYESVHHAEKLPVVPMIGHNVKSTTMSTTTSMSLSQHHDNQQLQLQHIAIYQRNYTSIAQDVFISLINEVYRDVAFLDLAGPGTVNNEVLLYLSTLILPSLKHLELKATDWKAEIDPSILCSIFQQGSIPNLTGLVLNYLNMGVDNSVLASMIPPPHSSLSSSSGLNRLENITLCYCNGVTEQGILRFLEAMGKQLRVLNVTEPHSFEEDTVFGVFQCIAENFTNLEELGWYGVQYTEFGVQVFLDSLDILIKAITDKNNNQQQQQKNNFPILKKMEVSFDAHWVDFWPALKDLRNLHPKIDYIAQEWKYSWGEMCYEENNIFPGVEEKVRMETTHVDFRKGNIIHPPC